jgi:hypothetical protein
MQRNLIYLTGDMIIHAIIGIKIGAEGSLGCTIEKCNMILEDPKQDNIGSIAVWTAPALHT